MKISIIVAVGKNFEIGLIGKLLWHIPDDLKNFKSITKNHHMLMGRKTFESLNCKALPNRTSIVISKSTNLEQYKSENIFVAQTIEEGIKIAQERNETELFIIGGGEIYKQAMEFSDRIYLSKVNYSGEADTFFPTITQFAKWNLITHEDRGTFIFEVYEKK